LFFINVRDAKTQQLNNIEIIRLKNKLGTRQLPTAELLLTGTSGSLVRATHTYIMLCNAAD
jgi:hypothetical protein